MFNIMYPGIANSPVAKLVTSIDSLTSEITIDDITKLPPPPNIATIGTGDNPETIKYEGVSGNTLLNVTRGFQGNAQSWEANTSIARFYTAYDHNSFINNIEQINNNLFVPNIILLHTNFQQYTSSTEYEILYKANLIVDSDRHSSVLKLAFQDFVDEDSEGMFKVEITDGINLISYESPVCSSPVVRKTIFSLDCSDLQNLNDGKMWSISIYGRTIIGSKYYIKRFNIQSQIVDQFSAPTVLLVSPELTFSSKQWELLDSKSFPVTNLIDSNCAVRCLINISQINVVESLIKIRLKTEYNKTYTTEEAIINISSDGIHECIIQIPTLTAPLVNVEILGQIVSGDGSVTINHYEFWLEI